MSVQPSARRRMAESVPWTRFRAIPSVRSFLTPTFMGTAVCKRAAKEWGRGPNNASRRRRVLWPRHRPRCDRKTLCPFRPQSRQVNRPEGWLIRSIVGNLCSASSEPRATWSQVVARRSHSGPPHRFTRALRSANQLSTRTTCGPREFARDFRGPTNRNDRPSGATSYD